MEATTPTTTPVTPTKPAIPVRNEAANLGPNAQTASGKFPVMGSFFERLVALIVDAFIILIGSTILTLPLGFLLGASNGNGTSIMFSVLQQFIILGIVIGYYVYFYTQKGQSLGKQIMKLKVVNSDDLQYLTPGRVILREIVGKFISSLLIDLGYLWYFMSEKRQTWHDSIASTYVVKTDEKGEILMNGPATYEKKPVLAFLPCGCFGIFFILIFVLAIISAVDPTAAIKKAQVEQQKQAELQNLNQEGTLNPVDVDIDSEILR